MEVGDQCHVPATVHPGKKPLLSTTAGGKFLPGLGLDEYGVAYSFTRCLVFQIMCI